MSSSKPYLRPALTLDDQVRQLQQAGLGGQPVDIQRRLVAVGYHRLKPYWHPFRMAHGDLGFPEDWRDWSAWSQLLANRG